MYFRSFQEYRYVSRPFHVYRYVSPSILGIAWIIFLYGHKRLHLLPYHTYHVYIYIYIHSLVLSP